MVPGNDNPTIQRLKIFKNAIDEGEGKSISYIVKKTPQIYSNVYSLLLKMESLKVIEITKKTGRVRKVYKAQNWNNFASFIELFYGELK